MRAAARKPSLFLGMPGASWAFAIRIWLATIIALYVSFWLELETPSPAAITVAILALPSRGLALDKAAYRLVATAIGVGASLLIVGVFAQSGVVLPWVYASWIGLCVYGAGMLDGNRAYAAALCVSTVAIVAITDMDAPQQVFDMGVARGSAICVGVLAIAFVNDVLGAPDHYLRITAQLRALEARVRAYAPGYGPTVASEADTARLLHDITALRTEAASLTSESSAGHVRRAAARATLVNMVATIAAARGLAHLAGEGAVADGGHNAELVAQARAGMLAEFGRRQAALRDDLADLAAGRYPRRSSRTPLYRSRRLALESGFRAVIYFGLAQACLGLVNWPAATLSLSFIAILIGLGATTPDFRAFTTLAVIIAPVACALAGVLLFVVLDGATGFPMLAIGLAPFVIGCALLMSLPSPALSNVGRLTLVFVIALAAPVNPQTYDPETFLFSCLFVVLATTLLFALLQILPPRTPAEQIARLAAEARRDLLLPHSAWRRDLAPEEAAFRDALRIGQIVELGGAAPQASHRLDDLLLCFDRASAVRQCDTALNACNQRSPLTMQAQRALADRDANAMLDAATALQDDASRNGAPFPAASVALVLAAAVWSPRAAPRMEEAANVP